MARLGDIDRLVDIESVKSNDWGNDYVVKERKQAEFLIMGDIPTSAIATICCYSSTPDNVSSTWAYRAI